MKLRIIPLLILTPIASIFEITGESYLKKVKRNYKELIDVFKM